MDISQIDLEDRTLLRVMAAAVGLRPDDPAVSEPDRIVTYAELWDRGLQVSGGLGRVASQDAPIAIMLDNHIDNVVAWVGINLGGFVELSLNTALKGQMLAWPIADSGAETILCEDHYVPELAEIADRIPGLRNVVVRGATDEDIADHQKRLPGWRFIQFAEVLEGTRTAPCPRNPWDLSSITYTSGTTGRSKGVLCPHAHAFNQATGDGLGNTRVGEVRLVVLPQFHAAGRWGGVYHSLIHGATAHLVGKFSASQFWTQAKIANAKTSQLVGTMAAFLARQPESENDRNHSLREICVLPLPPQPEKWARRFGVNIATSYGSTEVGSITNATSLHGMSVGRVREGYDIRIFDENDIEVPIGTVGEAVVRASLPWTTSIGYLNRPEETAKSWRNGWLHTGDALYRDADGYFYFVDRIDDAIRRRGENISSAEVEMHVLAHELVAECAAVAVASEFVEDEIKISVVLHEGKKLGEAALVAFLEREMPRFMVPRYIEFVEELPKTQTGKVRKKELRAVGTSGCWDCSQADGGAALRGAAANETANSRGLHADS